MEDDMECRQQPRCDELLELREEVKRLKKTKMKIMKAFKKYVRNTEYAFRNIGY